FSFTVARPPRITSFSPADGSEDIGVARPVVVNFDLPVDPTTVTTDTFYLIANSERVAGSVSVSSTLMFATFFPTNPLPASTQVRVVVECDKVLGMDGLALDGDANGIAGGQAVASFLRLLLTRCP